MAATMRLQGLACAKTELRRHIKDVDAASTGHEKHCRSALTFALNNRLLFPTAVCACHSLSGLSHDILPLLQCLLDTNNFPRFWRSCIIDTAASFGTGPLNTSLYLLSTLRRS